MDSDPRFAHGETNYLGALALGSALLLREIAWHRVILA
jgi:hypothetical protein